MQTSAILTEKQMEEIKGRYPEQKPVCLNYAHCRQDIFSLLAMVKELREQNAYYKELCARQADPAFPYGERHPRVYR